MITHTISVLELAWTLIALAGLTVQVALLRRSRDDYEIAQHYDGNPVTRELRIFAAKTSVLIFLGGCIWQIVLVTIGIIAMTQPSVHQHLTLANYINSSVIMTGSIIGVTFGTIIYRRRVKIVEMIENQ